MRNIDLSFEACDDAMICIGKQGENRAVCVRIDCRETLFEHEGASALIKVENANGVVYPGQAELTDGVLEWTITKSDTAYAGLGKAQIELTGPNGEVIKTAIIQTGVLESLQGAGETPDPVQDWLEEAVEKLQALTGAVDDAFAAASAADDAADDAILAAGDADDAAGRANDAAESIEGLTISESVVEYGAGVEAVVSRDPESGALHVAIQTERGPQGPGYTIKGEAYATVEALEAAVTSPAVGDQYNVGAAAPYNVYRWTGAGWEDQGKIQGPPGQNGLPGEPGADGADAAAPRMLSFSLPASGWAGSGPYTCAISESSATANTAVVECALTAATRANQLADIDWTTSAGSIALSTTVKPAGELAGYMILTEVQ